MLIHIRSVFSVILLLTDSPPPIKKGEIKLENILIFKVSIFFSIPFLKEKNKYLSLHNLVILLFVINFLASTTNNAEMSNIKGVYHMQFFFSA